MFEALSTRRLLTQEWLEGEPVTRFDRAEAATRNAIALGLFEAWWRPFSRFGVIHGDPHLGNYSVVMRGPEAAREVEAINLYDYGCVRIFPADLRRRRRRPLSRPGRRRRGRVVHAYESWGFVNLSRATVDALNIWARFIYGPLIDDRVRTIADGVKPGEYGRREIATVMQALKAQGGALKVPREFVFMDRAAIGLGGAFLRLGAELNFHRLFEDTIEGFEATALAARQAEALERVSLA